MDPEYKRMMLWVLAALVAALVAGFTIVEFTIRHFAE
jgi:hypothetical protein